MVKRKAKPASKPKTTKKRKSMPKDTLTGGTKDVNPQFYSGVAHMSAADTTTSTGFPLPVTRIPTANNVTIIEVLKVYCDLQDLGAIAEVTEISESVMAIFTTVNFGVTKAYFNEPNCWAFFRKNREAAFTAGGTYSDTSEEPLVLDLTDGAGHGILLATDQFFVQVSSTNTVALNSCFFKILYRFKTVGIAEYVGIVQSQQ